MTSKHVEIVSLFDHQGNASPSQPSDGKEVAEVSPELADNEQRNHKEDGMPEKGCPSKEALELRPIELKEEYRFTAKIRPGAP
jgi:hypothetical protein